MPAEPNARPAAAPVTTFARVRRVVGRLLGPWAWALAALGAVLLAFPPGGYLSPGLPASSGMPAGGRTFKPEGQSEAQFHADAARRLPPRLGAQVGAPTLGGLHHWPWRPRVLTLSSRTPARSIARAGGASVTRFVVLREWDVLEERPGWGVTWWRGWTGQSVTGPGRVFMGPWEWEESGASVSLGWFVGLPLALSLWRAGRGASVGRGEPRPPGRWDRLIAALRPAAWTAAAFAVGCVILGSGWRTEGGTAIHWGARRDPLHAPHPRFLRLDVSRPATDDDASWALGRRAWGLQISRLRHVPAEPFTPESAAAQLNRAWRGGNDADPDFPDAGRVRFAVDLSLWYALLPAALWSGGVLWRARAGRMRPA